MSKPLLETPTLTAHGRTVGRPRKEPPPDIGRLIERAATEHKTLKLIAAEIGTDPEILRRWMRNDPMLAWAYDAGKSKAEHELVTLMLRDARDGEKPNVNAMFLLKTRHGYREGDPGDEGNRLNIVFNLPGAMSRADFMKTVVPNE